jgi:hypothetical protein
MKTVRRLYFYAVALISIEVVLWGLINLLRSIVGQTVGGTGEVLAVLALTVVGPIFLFHGSGHSAWPVSDDEERTASMRRLLRRMLATLIPLVQNAGMLNRIPGRCAANGRDVLGSSGLPPTISPSHQRPSTSTRPQIE